MMKKYASFDLWMKDQSAGHRKLIAPLRKLVNKVAPKLTESVKWGNGVWLGKKWPVIFIFAGYDDELQFGFFGGASLKDPKELLHGDGKYVRHTKVFKRSDIDVAAFSKLIRQAVKLETG